MILFYRNFLNIHLGYNLLIWTRQHLFLSLLVSNLKIQRVPSLYLKLLIKNIHRWQIHLIAIPLRIIG